MAKKIFMYFKICMQVSFTCNNNFINPLSSMVYFTSQKHNDKQDCFISKNSDYEKYKSAQKYCNFKKLPFIRGCGNSWSSYNLNKTEGIQYGIPIFDGLNMKEIAFIFKNFDVLAIKRGCHNQCLHCYADAKPPIKENKNSINKMPFETFSQLINGITELKKRMGIDYIYNNKFVPTLFYDADCMDIVLYDKNCKEHNFIELSQMLCDSLGCQTLFDTAGWNHKSKIMQDRAEKYVKEMLFLNEQAECFNKEPMFYQINLSLSPFNPIYAKALELGYDPAHKDIKSEDIKYQKGEQCYRLYIERMANMLYTFTPLLKSKNFNIISRPVANNLKNLEEFNLDAYNIIKQDILEKLKDMYQKDLLSEKKYVKCEQALFNNLKKYKFLMEEISENLSISGRLKTLYDKKNITLPNNKSNSFPSHILKRKTLIDVNGKVYIEDKTGNIIPTELQLNLSTKDKQPPKFLPQDDNNFVINRELINKLM